MLLTVDVGNTNVVCAVYDGTTQCAFWRLATRGDISAEQYQSDIVAGAGAHAEQIHDAIIASVVPQVTTPLVTAVTAITGVTPLVMGEPQVDLGLQVRIDDPAQAGDDRLADAVGAFAHYKAPLIVLDFGTATTLDLVSADGAYEGGIIAPGVNLSIEALDRAAAQLPRLAVRPWDDGLPVLGKNTISAMESGIFWGYVGMIEGLLARLRHDHGEDLTVIATGGLAGLFADHVSAISAVDQDLTVKGLVEIYARNRDPHHPARVNQTMPETGEMDA